MKITSRCFAIVSITALLALSACTEKRPERFSQGQGTNLDTIAAWSSRLVDVQTGEVIGAPPTTQAQEKVQISADVKSMNHFDLVQLKIADAKTKELVGSPPFRARPDTQGVYQLQIKLTDNYLKILKVAKAEDLPFEEHFYTEETLADGRISIPLVGYKIKAFYRIEAQKTSDDQDSHHLIEVEEEDTAKATHVRIDWASRELFEPIKKVDLFPAELFFEVDPATKKFKPFEWYHAETVTEKSMSDSNTIVGETANRVENSKLNPANKVVFLPREGELRVVNVVRDERLSRDQIQNGADLNNEATMLLPVQWRDYRTKSEGTSLSMKGETVEERKWSERKFFEVDFTELESAAILNGGRAGSAGNQLGTNRLIDIEIDTNYFSFTILNMVGSNGRKIHYSFLRADRDRLAYAPKRSFKDDRNTFGFFSTTKPFYPNWEYYTENDFNKRLYTSRMNPAQKEITFHLSKDSPKELEGMTAKAVEAWDRAFQQALKGTGRDLRVKLSPVRAQLGDLRYNVIHLVDTLNEDGLLGFGPSVTDPETGEIVSATTNVYVNSFQAISANTVRQYILNRLEKRLNFDGKTNAIVADPAAISSGSAPKSRALLALERLQTTATAGLPTGDSKWNQLLAFDDATEKKLRDEALGDRCQYATSIVSNTSDKEIREHCPGIEKVIDAHKNDSFLGRAGSNELWEQVWSEAREAIRDCSKKLVEEKLVSTLIHEVGHNLGLRHNFYGSYDKSNFRTIKNGAGKDITPQSSSIMEYTVWEEDRLTEAGLYDVAAIKFGYGDSVDVVVANQVRSVPIPTDSSIAQGLKKVDAALTRAHLKPYLFCTDEEAYLSFNALCRPQDFGTSPKEIVKYYVDLYDRLQEIRKYRRVRPSVGSPEFYANDNAGRIFVPLKEIYDQWRYLLGEYVRKSNRYLTDYTPEQYEAILKGMKEDKAVYGQIYAQYHDAAQEIYKFFLRVAFASNQYCIIEEASGRRPVEFDRLRDLLSEATRGAVQIRSCADAAEASALAEVLGDKSVKVVAETGSPVNSYRYDPATTVIESVTDDVVGNGPTRQLAGMILTFRYPNVRNIINKFMPNMMDEPTRLKEMKEEIVDRVTKGVKFAKGSGIEGIRPVFEQETTLFSTFATMYKSGLFVPNANMDSYDLIATRTKLRDYFVYRPIQGESPQGVTAVLSIDGRVAFVSTGVPFTDTLINTYNQVNRKLAMPLLSASYVGLVEPFLKKQLPPQANVAAMKVNDLLPIYEAVQGFRSKSGNVLSCVATKSPALTQLLMIFTQLEKDFGDITTQAQADALKAALVTEYVKATLKQEFNATLENLGAISDQVKTCIETQNLDVVVTNKYRKDLTSQKSLILNTLSAFAQ